MTGSDTSPDDSRTDTAPLTTFADDLTADLEAVVDEASERRTDITDSIKQLKAVEEELHQRADTLLEAGAIDEQLQDAINDRVGAGEYGAARDLIVEHAPTLEFDDEGKAALAAACGETFDELVGELELMRNALLDLVDTGWDDEDLVAFVYGQHPSLTKAAIRGVLDVAGDVSDVGVEVDELGRFVASRTRDVTVADAQAVVAALEDARPKGGGDRD